MVAAVIGKNYTTSATFMNEDKTPFEVTMPVSFKVYAFDNTFIVEGLANQDLKNPSIWYASFSIPEGAPVPDDVNNQQYRIDWFAQGENERLQASQQIQVISEAEPIPYDSTVLALLGQPIVDNLITPAPLANYSINIQDLNGKSYFTKMVRNPKFVLRNNNYITRVTTGTKVHGITDVCMGFAPFQAVYTLEFEDGQIENEIHMIYTVNNLATVLINNMRRYLDRARNWDIDEYLRLTEEDYIHFLTVGLQRINTAPPNITSYTMCNFPQAFLYVWEKCAEVELLNAMFLAEGMRGFEFTGASVTLNVNSRKEAIQTKMDEINGWLDNNLKATKELMIRSSNSAGNLGISISSVSNSTYPLRYPGVLRGLLRRY